MKYHLVRYGETDNFHKKNGLLHDYLWKKHIFALDIIHRTMSRAIHI